jgi:phenylacetate-coenzyme A ligase PaaK-like adenylate-forming protein
MFEQLLAMRQVLRDQRCSSDEIRKLQLQRLRFVLISAYENTEYYRQAMRAAGYDPRRDFNGPEDLAHLPILSKEILKERGTRDFVRKQSFEQLDEFFCDVTSGTTGLPLTIYRDRYSRALQVAKWLRVLFDNGYRPTQRAFSFTAQTQLEAGRSLIQRFGLFRRQVIAYEADPEQAYEAIRAYRPHLLYGTRTAFDFIFDVMEQRGEKLRGVELVIMTGERIHAQIRERCRSLTGVDVTESYGTIEMGIMAYETPNRNGLQLNEDLTYFEFVDENGAPAAPGQEARIIVTDLSGTLMPLIRYEQGDRVVFTEGITESDERRRRIQRIIGRDDDYATLSDGSRRSFLPFYEALEVFSDVKRFRVVQVEPDLFDILIVADKVYFDGIEPQAVARLRELCGTLAEYRLRLVDEIPKDPSGKLRMMVSNVGRGSNWI